LRRKEKLHRGLLEDSRNYVPRATCPRVRRVCTSADQPPLTQEPLPAKTWTRAAGPCPPSPPLAPSVGPPCGGAVINRDARSRGVCGHRAQSRLAISELPDALSGTRGSSLLRLRIGLDWPRSIDTSQLAARVIHY
jgi:hypothetical protein